jgi:hypothetical protein
MKLIFACIYWTAISAVSSTEPQEVAEYFSPLNPDWFWDWHTKVLGTRKPDLAIETDPHFNKFDKVKQSIIELNFGHDAMAYLSNLVLKPAAVEAVVRSVIVIRMLSDLGLLVGDGATGPHFQRIGRDLSTLPRHSPQAHSMTFQMSIVRCQPAWDSVKRIAEQHGVSPVKLAGKVGLIGSHLGTRWMYQIMGIRMLSRPQIT